MVSWARVWQQVGIEDTLLNSRMPAKQILERRTRAELRRRAALSSKLRDKLAQYQTCPTEFWYDLEFMH